MSELYQVVLTMKIENLFVWLQDVDIKRQGAASAFAFVQYTDITSVVHALREMEGKHIGANKIKVSILIFSSLLIS